MTLLLLLTLLAPSIDDARTAEHDADPARAEALYAAILAREPGSPAARVADARLGWLRERNVDAYHPLARLLRMRTTTEHGLTSAGLESFAQEVDGWPSGVVRREARAFVAETAVHELNDASLAERGFHAWLAEPDLGGADRQGAISGLAQLEARDGRYLAALTRLRDAGFAGQPAYRQLKAVIVQKIGEPLALALLCLFALFAAVAALPRLSLPLLREAFRPSNLILTVYVTLIPGIIASRYESALGYTFERLGVSLAVVLAVAFVASAALQARGAAGWIRGAASVSAAAACLGAGFLCVARSEMIPALLRWRGL